MHFVSSCLWENWRDPNTREWERTFDIITVPSNDLVGQCEDGYGCAYSATISWRDATTPLPMEANPRAVFEHLFGASDSTERGAWLRRLQRDRSLLDSVDEELASLRRILGRSDRSKLADNQKRFDELLHSDRVLAAHGIDRYHQDVRGNGKFRVLAAHGIYRYL